MSIFCCFKHHHQSTGSGNEFGLSAPDRQRHFLQPNSPHESKLTLSSLKSAQDARDLHDIFSPPGDVNERGRPRTLSPTRLNESTRAKTNSSLSVLSSRLRKRFSKDSSFSKTSSGGNQITLPEEEAERRRELKRALYERVRTEIFQDDRESHAEYDADAQLIATPATVGSARRGGDIAVSPLHLSNVMRKPDLVETGDFNTSEESTDDMIRVRNGGETSMPRQVRVVTDAAVVSRAKSMMRKKVSVADMLNEPIIRKRSTISDLRPRKSTGQHPRPQFPLQVESKDLSEPVIHPNYIEISLTPDLLPLRLPSISASSERALRLSQPWNMGDQEHANKFSSESHRPSGVYKIDEGDWLRGASEASPAGSSKNSPEKELCESHAAKERFCDPVLEESIFGGINGEDATHWIPPDGPNGKAPQRHVSRREISKSSSTRRSSVSSPLMSAISVASTSGRNRGDYLRHHRESSQSKTFFQGSFDAVHRERRSNSYHGESASPTIWLPVAKDNASSVYASQAGSPIPSPSGSFVRPPNLIDRLRNLHIKQRSSPIGTANSSLIDLGRLSVSPLDSLEADLRRHGTTATSSFHSSSDSLRARELAAADLRIVSRSRIDSVPRSSRFKEDLDPTVDIPEESPSLLAIPHMGLEHGSMDGSEDWYSSGRRSGYGFAFLPGENAVAADSWERALRTTAEQNLLVPRKLSSAKQSSKSFQSQLAVDQAKKRLSMMATADTNFLSVEPRSNRFRESVEYLDPLKSEPVSSPDSGNSPHDASPPQPASAPDPIVQRPRSSPAKPYADSWTRFPSHSRAARSFAPAGPADNVIAHDFALDHPVHHKSAPAERGKLADSKAKTRSLHLGKALQSVGDLYKSHSATFARFEHGYRSSISAGGILRYPELEIPQPLAPSMVSSSLKEQRLSTESGKSAVEGDLFRLGDGQGSEGSWGEEVRLPPRNARVWSRLYEDCVQYPTSSEAGSAVGSPVMARVGRVSAMSRSCG